MGAPGWLSDRALELPKLALGSTPSPVFRIGDLEIEGGELWVKDDSALSDIYGGNKVRKLEWLLGDALRRGARRLLLIGAVGSHHVLATTLFARARGLPVAAVLTPQPWTPHAEQNLRAALSAGLEAVAAPSIAHVPWQLARIRRRGDVRLAIGGSSPLGSLGYVLAAFELADQIAQGLLPAPQVIVTALGSGGTAAGLALGAALARLDCPIAGVSVATGPRLAGWLTRRLIRRTARWLGQPSASRCAEQNLLVDGSELGPGYGHATARAREAVEIGRRVGIALDPTYTAKAFACALGLLEHPRCGPAFAHRFQATRMTGQFPRAGEARVVYWHTLSRIRPGPSSENGASAPALPLALRALLQKR